MELHRFLLEQLQREAKASRRAVERVPEGRNSYKPHERSMELGYLAALVATMPGWVAFMIELDELDLDSPSGQTLRTKAQESRADLLRMLDEGLERSLTALRNTDEEHLMKPWRLRMSGQLLSESPRYVSIADGTLTHMAHHRGQLTVYLRLLEEKVPALYGPSADEWH